MLATLSLGFALVLPNLQSAPATTMRPTNHARMAPPTAQLTVVREERGAGRRICATPEALRAATPPPGASYSTVIELPVIGEQHFRLDVTSDREAQLTMQGAIDLAEPIEYSVSSDGKLDFTLSETTTRILGRLGTTLLHAEYFKANDSSEITIAPPLGVPAVRVTLMRVDPEADELREAVTNYLNSADCKY